MAQKPNYPFINPSGRPLIEILSDPMRSYSPLDLDILESEVPFSRMSTSVDFSGKQFRFSRNIGLHLPIVTAPMPDVTDSHIATVAARYGCLGIIPATYSAEEQAEAVRQVKKTEGGFIDHPDVLDPKSPIQDALNQRYSNIPVVSDGKLVGIFIQQLYGDYYYRGRESHPISDVMEKDLEKITVSPSSITQNGELSFRKAQQIMEARQIPALAIVDKEMRLLHLVTMKDVVYREKTYPNATRDSKSRLAVGAAVLQYMTDENKQRILLLAEAGADVIVIEQAQAWNADVKEMTRYIKKNYPDIDVVPGNDSVPNAVAFHNANGADGVKIGQGPGSECTSGQVVGLWRPQLSAVFDCAEVARRCGIPCTADGGIKNAYDIFKLIMVGATTAMLGRLVAETKDSPAKEEESGKKLYRAMGSPELVKAHSSAFRKYDPRTFVAEGKSELLPITTTFEELLKGLKSQLIRVFERFGASDAQNARDRFLSGEYRAQYAHRYGTR